MLLSGKHVLITGAGSGLGAATAALFAQKGAQLSLLDVNAEALETQAKATGGKTFVCDVTSDESVKKALEGARAAYGLPHILVNCAGIAPGARLVGREGPMDLGFFTKVININLIGTFNVMRLSAAMMMENTPDAETQERGVIINTASVAAYEGQIGQAAYSASKGGVVAMTLPAARELAKFGIRVMTIAPGLMETPMLTGMPDEVYQSLVASTLFPHRLGKATEYAHLAASIVENPLLNGETIRLDGAIRLAPK